VAPGIAIDLGGQRPIVGPVAEDLHRRLVCGALAALAAAFGTRAMAADDLEGTWGGASGQLTAQVIVAGGQVLGFFWRDDYVEVTTASAAAGQISFDFHGGHAVLTRQPDGTAVLEVTEGGHATRMALKRD